ncbi:uncharacterized protein DEA37_0001860 [Paragonimus westermani]|uniref:Pecanex-like protein n=1 Tax=Paragonimus westermani TaxID=34504 RepID=A0A5J4NZQ2_9TREM|nr:uncharacterized protein DEA37_0001860 [Paragonimus westermani]
MEALQHNQSIVPRQLTLSSVSNRPHTGASVDDHPNVPAVNLEDSDVSSRALNNSVASENIHLEVPDRSSNCDKLVDTLIHEQALIIDTNLCTNQSEAKSAVSFKSVLIDKNSESLCTSVTPVLHSSPFTIRKPVHRQLSWVAANSFSEADHYSQSVGQNEAKSVSYSPSTSRSLYRRRSYYSGATELRFQLPGLSDRTNSTIPPAPCSVDLVRADMERCRLAIQQMKLDVHRLRARPRTKLSLSHKNFESVDLYPKRRNLPVGRPRSSSQRYHRSIWTSNFHASHRQASTLAYFPPSLFSRPMNHPSDIAELNLADAVLFWRRHFASADDTSRTVCRQSLRRPIQRTLSFKCCDRIREAHLEWRSNSLRHTYFSTTSALRQPLRRPGSALRLGRQQSMESASCRLGPHLVEVDTINLRLHSAVHSSPLTRQASVDNSLRGRLPIDGDVLTNVSVPSTSQIPLSSAATEEPHFVNEDEATEVHLPSPPDADALMCVVNDCGSLDGPLSNTTVSRRLNRRRGFRRKTLLPVTCMPKQGTSQSVTGLSSRGLEVCNDFDGAGGDTQSKTSPNTSTHSRTETGVPDPRKADCERSAMESTAYARIPEASTSAKPTRAAAHHTVDVILAQLMGVSSLADAGLTHEQCLAQLRDSGNPDESESAELDILFAVTAATCSVDEPSVSRPTTSTEHVSALSCLSDHVGVADHRTSNSSMHVTVTRRRGLTETARSAIQLDGSEESVEAVSLAGMNDARSNPASPHPTLFKRLNAMAFAPRRRRLNSHIYRVRLFPCFARPSFNVRLSRLQLDALFDRGRSPFEFALAVFLSLTVSLTGFLLLRSGAFHQMGLVACCFTIAGCHYSLVKSVQPDAASPQHGFNRVIVYSRSVVFCLFALIYVAANLLSSSPSSTDFRHQGGFEHSTISVLATVRIGQLSLIDKDSCFPVDGNPLLCSFDTPPMKLLSSSSSSQLLQYFPKDAQSEHVRLHNESHSLFLFGSIWTIDRLTFGFRSVMFALLTIFPLLFLFGLIPQINTALIFILEQLDIHLFGGSGSIGLLSASFSIVRSLVVVGLGYWFCYSALETGDAHHLWFSGFWSLYIPLCFVLSRLPCNPELYTTLSSGIWSRELWRRHLAACLSKLTRSLCWFGFKSKIRNGSASECNDRCGCGGPCWFWSKKPKPLLPSSEPSAWLRGWLPFISDVDKKSAIRAKSMTDPENADWLLRLASSKSTSQPNEASTEKDGLPMTISSYPSGSLLKGRKYVSSPSLFFVDPPDGGSHSVHVRANSFRRCHPVVPSSPTLVCSKQPKHRKKKLSTTYRSSPDTPVEHEYIALPSSQSEVVDQPVGSAHSLSNTGRRQSNFQTCSHAINLSFTEKEQARIDDFLQPKLPIVSDTHAARSTLTENEMSADLKLASGIPCHHSDPLPSLIHSALVARLRNDFICSVAFAVSVFGLHASPALSYTLDRPIIQRSLTWTTVLCGGCLHYIWPNLRKSYPWLCVAKPVIRTHSEGKLSKWEIGYFWFCWFERNLLIPAVTVLTVSHAIVDLVAKFPTRWATIIVLVTSMKMLRNGFAAPGRTFLTLFFTELLFNFDFALASEVFPLNYFLVSILLCKILELVHKLHFVYTYTTPFRITWGSVTHAILHVACIPHVLFMLGNCVLSTILSSPLEPFLASALFITSYVRPIKFWEVNHRTERMETTNTALASQLRGIAEKLTLLNLNAIFYERLARDLQATLAGDIQLGRLGGLTVRHGDILIMGSEDLNFVIHIIEVGNGMLSFQLRGLEFLGTYCHALETEALRSHSHNDNECCCCHPGHCPGLLSLNAALRMRCMTWQFVADSYNVRGYRMTSHCADTGLRMNDLRKILVNRFVQCIIYYVLQLPDLPQRLETITPCLRANNFFSSLHFDLDPVFLKVIDEDFDEQLNGGIVSCEPDSALISLCYALAILGRRCMGGVQATNYDVNQVLRGIHDVFKGDVLVMTKDEWVLADLDLLQTVVSPAMRVALKLYQDNFIWSSDLTHNALYRKIVYTENNFVICHETDPRWRLAVLNDAHSLFSIRWVGTESNDMYRIVQLTKSNLQFCAVKINSECVRGLWAGQQREQIFLRNTNLERGSIQGAQHVLRNLVNSCCDPPIGYPIYVSPILTSFAGSNSLYGRVAGPELSFKGILSGLWSLGRWLFTKTCRQDCRPVKQNIEIPMELVPRERSGDGVPISFEKHDNRQGRDPSTIYPVGTSLHTTDVQWPSASESMESMHQQQRKSLRRGSTHVTTLAALVHEHHETEGVLPSDITRSGMRRRTRVKIVDPTQILNDRHNKLQWPSEEWRARCLSQSACISSVHSGLEGQCVHRWTPSNPDPMARSFCHQTICLITFPGGPPLLEGHYIAIWEDKGVSEVPPMECASESVQSGDESLLPNRTCDFYAALPSLITAFSSAGPSNIVTHSSSQMGVDLFPNDFLV